MNEKLQGIFVLNRQQYYYLELGTVILFKYSYLI